MCVRTEDMRGRAKRRDEGQGRPEGPAHRFSLAGPGRAGPGRARPGRARLGSRRDRRAAAEGGQLTRRPYARRRYPPGPAGRDECGPRARGPSRGGAPRRRRRRRVVRQLTSHPRATDELRVGPTGYCRRPRGPALRSAPPAGGGARAGPGRAGPTPDECCRHARLRGSDAEEGGPAATTARACDALRFLRAVGGAIHAQRPVEALHAQIASRGTPALTAGPHYRPYWLARISASSDARGRPGCACCSLWPTAVGYVCLAVLQGNNWFPATVD